MSRGDTISVFSISDPKLELSIRVKYLSYYHAHR